MKKIIGILGVAFIAIAMFFNTSGMNSSNGDLDLASILNMNTANAECTINGPGGVSTYCPQSPTNCAITLNGNTVACHNSKFQHQ